MLCNSQIVPYIRVSDVTRARRFYEEKLGLKVKQEYAGGVIYECGNGSWVFMYPSAGAGTSKASTAFWSVDDVEAEVVELKARAVTFEECDASGFKTIDGIPPAEEQKRRGSRIPRETFWRSVSGSDNARCDHHVA